jgi:diguanylate cyclase (GGDEF)-like protein
LAGTEETTIYAFISILEKQPKAAIVLGAFLLAVCLGVIDLLSGFEIAFSFFYLLPVSLAAWAAGNRIGILLSALCAGIWMLANNLAGQTFSLPLVSYWNALTRFGFFVVVTLLLAELRRLFNLERHLARTDPLTGMLNRRAFLEIVLGELERARRFGHPLTLLYLDIDDFKSINDDLGHAAGDNLLGIFGDTISTNIRSVDTISRLGGDEFAVLLPETDRIEAEVIAQRLQQTLNNATRQQPRPVTVSIGTVTCNQPPPSANEVLALADKAMYEVKRSGKNGIHYSVYPD